MATIGTMKMDRTLRNAPNGEAIDESAEEGDRVEILEKKDSFTKIRLIAKPGKPEGWVSSDAVDETGTPPAQPIDKAKFARACWRGALIFGVNPHYMMAVAEHRSRVRNDHDGAKIGPFRLTQAEWDAHRTDAEFDFDFPAERIHEWRMQCPVFALMVFRAQSKFVEDNGGKRPTAVELYLAQLKAANDPSPPTAQKLTEDLNKALHATGLFIQEAGSEVLADALTALTPTSADMAHINFTRIPAGREDMARLIVTKFAEAGYGPLQQIAALANAIGESNLNPNAHNTRPPENSVGLFQLNINGGVGSGKTVPQLKDPVFNTSLIIKEAQRFDAFKNATSLLEAVNVFVRKVERPRDQDAAVQKRMGIANTLLA